MKEEFLHFIWKHKLFDQELLFSTEGELIEIASTGRHNIHAGPDFFDARIKIGQTLWAGNVEIHIKSSDWNRHGHQTDPLYRNTILHVVAEDDIPVMNDLGSTFPTFILTWPAWIVHKYNVLMQQHNWVNCASELYRIDPFRIRFFLNGLAIERLKQKIEIIEKELVFLNEDWNETFFRFLFRSFGFRQNGDPFEMLAKSLSLSVILRHRHNLFQTEALLFGQAGMLAEPELFNDYAQLLKREYEFLAMKYKLKPMQAHLWRFLRMHPQNFPTIRLAQLAGILHHSKYLFSSLLDLETLEEMKSCFRYETSEYWNNHYTLSLTSTEKKKPMGIRSIHSVLINVIVPFLFLYGERTNRAELKDRALKMMEELPTEDNVILRHWARSGITAGNALESQSLLLLHQQYCEPKRCLECTIGERIVLHEE